MDLDTLLDIDIEEEDPESLFELVSKIGPGACGTVFKGRNRITGEFVAIKQIVLSSEDELEQVKQEILILQECHHPNVVQYRGTYKTLDSLWITMEYCSGGSVDAAFNATKRPLKESQIAFIMREVLHGLQYMHAQKKIHRDIKAGNVLIADNGAVRLADFGVSAQLLNTMSRRNTFVGTLYWMAPEAILEKEYDERADVWSLGITALEMAELAPPHMDHHQGRVIFIIPKEPPPQLQERDVWSPRFQNFLARCLVKDPAHRPTAAQLLSDPFITECTGSSHEMLELVNAARAATAEHEASAGNNHGNDDSDERTLVDRGDTSEDDEDDDDDDRTVTGFDDDDDTFRPAASAAPKKEAPTQAVPDATPLCITDGTVLRMPVISLDDMGLDELTLNADQPFTDADVVSLLSSRPVDEAASLPAMMPATAALLHAYRHHKEGVYTGGLTKAEVEHARTMATTYGSVLKTIYRL
jgi:serine/threonine protein kinase